MNFVFFLIFSLLAVGGAVSLVVMRNPVSSALSMVASFVGMAALFIGMNAYFVGIIQILVYSGAIMVLFLFIIMLLDLKVAEKVPVKGTSIAAAIFIPLALVIQIVGVLGDTPEGERGELTKEALIEESQATVAKLDKNGAPVLDENGKPVEVLKHGEGTHIQEQLAEGRLPDVHLIGKSIFTDYNAPLQIMGILLFVATVGCVTLSHKERRRKG